MVSNLGQVCGPRGHLLSPYQSDHGYMYVQVPREGKPGTEPRTVHTMVLEAFAGGRPAPGWEARHLNDVKDDNRWPWNLCWGTKAQNVLDAIANGIFRRTARHGTTGGYRRHTLDGEDPCEPCREANKRYCRDRRAALKEGA